jgi:predicted metal-dependent hydrolase
MKVRYPSFDILGAEPHWGDNPAACNVINGGAIIPAPIERYLIKLLRMAKKQLDPVADAALLEDIAIFNKQEGQHYKFHNEYMEMVAAKGYPGIRDYEAAFEADLTGFLADNDLEWNLAYAEGFESSGPALAAGWLDGGIAELCADRDSEIMRLWTWHLAEEFEHRTVVHDVMQRICGPDKAVDLRRTVASWARGHYGGHAGDAATYLFSVDRASMSDEERVVSEAAELAAWLGLGALGAENLNWIEAADYDPAKVPAPAGYERVLAEYS